MDAEEQKSKKSKETEREKKKNGSPGSLKSTPKHSPLSTPKQTPPDTPVTSRKVKKECNENDENTKFMSLRRKPDFYEISSYVDISKDLSDHIPPVRKTLSEETLEQIQKFREHPEAKKYIKEHHHDFYISRWLTARKGDVEKSVTLFVESMKWREENSIDTIMETFPKWEHFEKLVNYWPGSLLNLCPYTYDGSPVMYEAMGRCDSRMLEFFGLENVLKFHIYGMEKIQRMYWELTEKFGYFPGIVVIQDLGGVGWSSLSQTALKAVQRAAAINQNNYPDQLRKLFIVNTPHVVNMMWNVASLWFDPRTLAKFEFCSGGPDVYREKFTKIIPDFDLPKRLGGTMDNDIPSAGTIDIEENFQKIKRKKIEVPRGGNHVHIIATEKGDLIQFEFDTNLYDISFAVFFMPNEDLESREEIFLSKRVESHKERIGGTFVKETDGIYEFIWDNSYSWTRGKTLKYTILRNSNPVH